jgi:rhodanese-related sulfurtransferase
LAIVQKADNAIKNAYAKGKVKPELDQYITSLRQDFERFTTMKPVVHSRFAAKRTDPTEIANAIFSGTMLAHMRLVFGTVLDHATAAENLKKRFKPDTLKSNKAFVEFFSPFFAEYNKAKAGFQLYLMRKQTEPTPDQTNYANQLASSFAWYLKFTTTPTKEQLAAHMTDLELKHRSGRFLANLDDSVAKRTRELAKQALTQLPKQRPLYLICLAQAHSERAAAALKEAGASDIFVVDGGVDNWVMSGVPTEYNAATTAKLDEAVKTGMRGAPTNLGDINN